MAGNLILPTGLGAFWRRHIYARPVVRAASPASARPIAGDRPAGGQRGDRDAIINGQRLIARGEARQRLSVLVLLFFAVPFILALRLTDLAVFEAQPAAPRVVASAAPPRADITDRDGVELARTFEAFAISVEPRKLASNPAVLARKIAAILTDKTEAQIYAELTHKGQFRYISRRVLPSEAKRINDLGEPAIYLRREAERLYPNFNLASHVIGYNDDKGRGMVGLEKAFNARLAEDATRGTPLKTTLDVRVQQALEHELRGVFTDQNADAAAGIVMDVHTGEVVAMTSQPDFNPNAPGQSTTLSRYNQATFATFELGSTFKAFTIANGLDSGVIPSMTKTYDATQSLVVDHHTIHDDHALNRWLNVPDIFIHSSNIGTARIADEIGRDRQRDMLEKLGFFKQVPFELKERSRPQYPPLSNWGRLAVMTIGYGHGISVTPLHLAAGYAALVNGGIYRNPTLLPVQPGAPIPGHRVYAEKTSFLMRQLLRLVVTSGTGRKADAPGYRVGGKTGTAEKVLNGRYIHGANVSTFASAFPMDAPRYVVVMMIDNPKGSKTSYGFKTAGMTIAPATGRLIARIGPLLGVRPDSSKDIDLTAVAPKADDKVEE
jgi:cell division protein FtsI (penicillin-binding protein 3)